jgi:hypothetical protein
MSKAKQQSPFSMDMIADKAVVWTTGGKEGFSASNASMMRWFKRGIGYCGNGASCDIVERVALSSSGRECFGLDMPSRHY